MNICKGTSTVFSGDLLGYGSGGTGGGREDTSEEDPWSVKETMMAAAWYPAACGTGVGGYTGGAAP